jgi:AMMECR1 domain-containing protein
VDALVSEALIAVARNALARCFNADRREILEEGGTPAALRVNVTLRYRGRVRGSMSAGGASLEGQIRSATVAAATDERFGGPLVSSELHGTFVELWIQTGETPLTFNGDESAFMLGVHGVELRYDQQSAYYKPSVALTSGFRSLSEMLGALARKAGLADGQWQRPSAIVMMTTWTHVADLPRGGTELVALRRPYATAPDVDRLGRWVIGAAEYLVRNQLADGGYLYRYRPLEGRGSNDDVNVVRAAGCAYAIAYAASAFAGAREHRRWRASAGLAVAGLAARAAPANGNMIIPDADTADTGKLGAVALLALAASYLEGDAVADCYTAAIATLKRARRDDGTFRCRLGEDGDDGSAVDFYPGQALLALSGAAARGDEESTSIARGAFARYRDHFRRYPRSAFVLWQSDAWLRFAALDAGRREEYEAFVDEQMDWLLQWQIADDDGLGAGGGFSGDGSAPRVSSLVYAEAIWRAAFAAGRRGDMARNERYRMAATSAMRFCARLRIDEELLPYLPDPSRSLGGFVASSSDYEIRSDYAQHAITCGLAALGR